MKSSSASLLSYEIKGYVMFKDIYVVIVMRCCDVAWQARRKRQEEMEKHRQEEQQRKQQVGRSSFNRIAVILIY